MASVLPSSAALRRIGSAIVYPAHLPGSIGPGKDLLCRLGRRGRPRFGFWRGFWRGGRGRLRRFRLWRRGRFRFGFGLCLGRRFCFRHGRGFGFCLRFRLGRGGRGRLRRFRLGRQGGFRFGFGLCLGRRFCFRHGRGFGLCLRFRLGARAQGGGVSAVPVRVRAQVQARVRVRGPCPRAGSPARQIPGASSVARFFYAALAAAVKKRWARLFSLRSR